MSEAIPITRLREPVAFDEKQRQRLTTLIESWECGARLSNEIVKAFQPDLDEFSAPERDNTKTYDLMLIRSVVDEKHNRDRLLKDAAALRSLLSAVEAHEWSGPKNGERCLVWCEASGDAPQVRTWDEGGVGLARGFWDTSGFRIDPANVTGIAPLPTRFPYPPSPPEAT